MTTAAPSKGRPEQAPVLDRRQLLARRSLVSLSMLACFVGVLFGIGVFGTEVREVGGGSFAADATLIAPATRAFSIWSVIYVGLVAYALWLWLPGRRPLGLIGTTPFLAAASMLLNAAWLLVVQQEWLWTSVAVMAALVVVLGRLVDRLMTQEAESWGEWIVVHATFGLYLGWVCLAACANVAVALVGSGFPATGLPAEAATIAVFAVVVGLAAYLARRFPGQLPVALGIAWGLAWIVVQRTIGEPQSLPVALAAALAAAAVVWLFLRRGRPGLVT